MPLAWLLGRWEGRGHGDYPTIEKFEFGQQIDFSHNGKPYLHYVSQTYVVGEDGTKERPLAVETGFWRPQPDNKVEVILAPPDRHRGDLVRRDRRREDRAATDVVARTVTAKEVTAGHRLYGLVTANCSGPTTWPPKARRSSRHLWATLVRI